MVLQIAYRRHGQGGERHGRRVGRPRLRRRGGGRGEAVRLRAGDGRRQGDSRQDHLPLRVHLHREADQEADGRLPGDGPRARDQEAHRRRAHRARHGTGGGHRRRGQVPHPGHRPRRAHGHAVRRGHRDRRHQRDSSRRARTSTRPTRSSARSRRTRTATRRRRSSSRRPASRSRSCRPRSRPTQATRVPGTQGDVLKVVENLPGVARAAVGLGRARRVGRGAARTRASTSTACTCRASTTTAGTARSSPRTS